MGLEWITKMKPVERLLRGAEVYWVMERQRADLLAMIRLKTRRDWQGKPVRDKVIEST